MVAPRESRLFMWFAHGRIELPSLGRGLDVDGVYAALGFAGQFDTYNRESLDIANCAPDGKIDLSDILAVLDSLQGVDPCCGN